MIETLDVRRIVVDLRLQTRTGGLDPSVLGDYVEAMERGDNFPPVVVYKLEDGTLLLADGFHRIRATELNGLDIKAEVREGTYQDALDFANFEANRYHGKRLTPSDMSRIVERAVTDPRFQTMSSRQLGKIINVSHTTITKVRKRLGVTMGSVVGEDGKVYSRFKDKDEFMMTHRSTTEKLVRQIQGLSSDITDLRDKLDPGQISRLKQILKKTLEEL